MKTAICKQLSDYAMGFVEHIDHEPELANKYAKWYQALYPMWERANDNMAEGMIEIASKEGRI